MTGPSVVYVFFAGVSAAGISGLFRARRGPVFFRILFRFETDGQAVVLRIAHRVSRATGRGRSQKRRRSGPRRRSPVLSGRAFQKSSPNISVSRSSVSQRKSPLVPRSSSSPVNIPISISRAASSSRSLSLTATSVFCARSTSFRAAAPTAASIATATSTSISVKPPRRTPLLHLIAQLDGLSAAQHCNVEARACP